MSDQLFRIIFTQNDFGVWSQKEETNEKKKTRFEWTTSSDNKIEWNIDD